jgi:peptidyl-prolyl cis-trans isomerase B (cyclophilin B)
MKNFKVHINKFSDENRISQYGFFNIDKISMKIFQAVFTKRLLRCICRFISMSVVNIETNLGKISFKLLPELATETVRNFQKLAKDGFYDGTLFHRVIPGFMIQGGDPNTKTNNKGSWGQGGPGYNIKAEFNSRSHLRGIVSMARSQDPDSAGSQFFIVTSDSAFLDRQYTVFGEVLEGMDVTDKIVNLDRDGNDCPLEKTSMIRVTVE